MIVWKIHLDEEGTTTPVLDLLPKVPEQGNLSHFRPWLWQWNCSSQSPTRQTHPNSALHLLCHLQGLTEPVCLQAPCFSPLLQPPAILGNDQPCCVCPAVMEQRMTTVGSLPGGFRSLLRLFGIEAAIENLITVLASEK